MGAVQGRKSTNEFQFFHQFTNVCTLSKRLLAHMNLNTLLFLEMTVAGTLLIIAVAFILGRSATELLRLRFDSFSEETACSVAAGLGVVALVVFLVGISRVLFPWVLGATIGLLVVTGIIILHRADRQVNRLRDISRSHLLVAFVSVLILVPLFALPLYPPTASDSITYHLAIAQRYLQTGSVQPTPQYRYAVFPQLVEMLFTAALMMGSDILAQCISLIFLLVTALAVAAFLRHIGQRAASYWGAALVFSNSVLLVLAGVAYTDMALMAFVAVAVLSFERWCEDKNDPWLVFSGVMAGCAAGTKYSALFFPLALGCVLIAVSRHQRSVRPLLTFIISCIIIALPWYLYNAYHTGNPVWPFFSSLFGHAYWNDADVQGQTADLLASYGTGTSMRALLMLPWNLFTHAEYFHSDGELSISLLIGIPFAIYEIAQKAYARRIAVVVLSFVLFWFYTSQILRYLIPVLPLVCVLAAAGMGRLFGHFFPSSTPARLFAVAIVAALLLLPGWRFALHTVTSMGRPPVSPGERDAFLEKRLPSYGAVRYLNSVAGSSYTLYSYGDARMAYYAEGEFRGDVFGPWRYSRLTNLLGGSEDSLRQELNSMKTSHLLIREGSGGSECKPDWLVRRFVVPILRSPGIALFAVKETPHAAMYGSEMVPTQAENPDNAAANGIRFTGEGGTMYYCSCVGESRSMPTTVLFQVTWLRDDGKTIRTDETTGVFLGRSDTLRVLSTAPAGSSSGLISCSPIGDAEISIDSFSLRSIRFEPVTL